jgi:hypothetical protein
LHGVDPSYSSIVNVKLFGRHGRPRASAMSSAQPALPQVAQV